MKKIVFPLLFGAWLVALIIVCLPVFGEWSATGNGPFIEESLKFLVALLFFKRVDVKSVPFIGLGFGIMERVFYHVGGCEFRGIVIWVHVIFGLVMTFFLYKVLNAKRSYMRVIYGVLAFAIPVSLHLLWNLFVLTLC